MVEKLGVPGKKLEHAGSGIADGVSDAGNQVDNAPGVGDALASPFERAASGAQP